VRILRSVDAWLVISTPATTAVPAMAAQLLFGRPYVLLIEDLWPDSVQESGFVGRGPVLDAMLRCLHAFCDASYRRASAVAVTSPGMADILRRRGVPGDKLAFIPNWVDEKTFRPVPRDESLARRLGLNGFVVMYAGSLGDVQGLDSAVQAARQLPDLADLRLVFVGGGVAESRLRAAAAGLDRVSFLEPQPMNRMAELMALSDVQLVSLKDLPLFHSTLPSKIAATLASARPLIGAVPGDAARLIEQSGGGITAAPGDASALEAAVRKMHDLDTETREAMGRTGRQFYLERISERVGSVALSELLERAVSGGPAMSLPVLEKGSTWSEPGSLDPALPTEAFPLLPAKGSARV
jgi:colanic acid biosynthesis glycosyl transferase WcaI